MVRAIFFFLIMAATILSFGCFDSPEKNARKSSQPLGDAELYIFSPGRKYFLHHAKPYQLSPDTSLKDALDSLGKNLAETYFQKTYTGKTTKIRFEVVDIDQIVIPSRTLRIATINMVDPDKDAMRYFFQNPPLVDGLVFLYNGEMLPELDHMNVEGILIPRLVQGVAKRAIYEGKR